MRHFINTILESEQEFYLRFGDIPEGERSGIGRAPNWIKAMAQKSDQEVGVSVYPVRWDEAIGRWTIEHCGNYATLDALIAEGRPAFIVQGEHVEGEDGWEAYGMDDEPLLKNVRIIRQIPYGEIYVPAWGQDGYIKDPKEIEAEDLRFTREILVQRLQRDGVAARVLADEGKRVELYVDLRDRATSAAWAKMKALMEMIVAFEPEMLLTIFCYIGEADQPALYRSVPEGRSWSRVEDAQGIVSRVERAPAYRP